MQLRRYIPVTLAAILAVCLLVGIQAWGQSTSSSHSVKKSKSHHTKKSRRSRGQQAIDSERTRQIQAALIREHYMSGEPSGKWDDATQQALRRYQADQGWQSKLVPDSRALIRLGLGPDHDHLLNPESAMTSVPVSRNTGHPARASSSPRVAAAPGGGAPAALPAASSPSTATNVGSVPDLSPSR